MTGPRRKDGLRCFWDKATPGLVVSMPAPSRQGEMHGAGFEDGQSAAYIYTGISVAADFELRSAENGETLWANRNRNVIRSFTAGASGSEMAIRQALEPAMREVADDALRTFPEIPGGVL